MYVPDHLLQIANMASCILRGSNDLLAADDDDTSREAGPGRIIFWFDNSTFTDGMPGPHKHGADDSTA